MADRRYRNDQFTGNPPSPLANTLAIAACHPMSHGWQVLYHNEQYDLPVYGLDEFRMMKHPSKPGWVVEVGGKQWHITGQMSEITARVKEALADVEN